MTMRSFRVNVDGTVTWTLRHDNVLGKPKPFPTLSQRRKTTAGASGSETNC